MGDYYGSEDFSGFSGQMSEIWGLRACEFRAWRLGIQSFRSTSWGLGIWGFGPGV